MATSKFFCSSFLLFMEKIIEISICIIYCFYQRYLFLNILVVFYLFSYLQLPERMNLIELNTEIHTYIHTGLQFENSCEVGVFSKLTNAYCLVAIGGSENFNFYYLPFLSKVFVFKKNTF
jgi:hypothetical protein